MKNAMTKTTFREIKGSFSRWFAILAICMLGVGFFCGIKVCKEAFILTGDTFLSDNCFYDYELISTLGLEEKDVSKFQSLDGIAKARGSYSSDALFLIFQRQTQRFFVKGRCGKIRSEDPVFHSITLCKRSGHTGQTMAPP